MSRTLGVFDESLQDNRDDVPGELLSADRPYSGQGFLAICTGNIEVCYQPNLPGTKGNRPDINLPQPLQHGLGRPVASNFSYHDVRLHVREIDLEQVDTV